MGWFGGWTASDAVLVYIEGTVFHGLNARYPIDANTPFGSALETESSAVDTRLLVGAAYTTTLGPTLTVEYVYNGAGYTSRQARAFYQLWQLASDAFTQQGPLRDLARLTLSHTLDTGHRFLRQHLALFQYVHNDIWDTLDLTLRWTQSLDDQSGQFSYVIEAFIGNYVQLFSVGTVNIGDGDTEFGTLLDYQVLLGIELIF